jgi:hypothetical protein
MFNRTLGILPALIGALLAGASMPAAMMRAAAMPKPRVRKAYPERSSRQQMRGFRRAQGGPGITLDASAFTYVPAK